MSQSPRGSAPDARVDYDYRRRSLGVFEEPKSDDEFGLDLDDFIVDDEDVRQQRGRKKRRQGEENRSENTDLAPASQHDANTCRSEKIRRAWASKLDSSSDEEEGDEGRASPSSSEDSLEGMSPQKRKRAKTQREQENHNA